jgi:drug/metabolite transporter (DMT)-like permease
MLPDGSLGVLSALASAVVWGSGDFTGGLAARRASQYQVLALSMLSGAAILLLLTLAWGEARPALVDVLWAAAAGFSGAVGIAALYRGLAVGQAAIVAPVSGVVGAALPVLAGAVLAGLPGPLRLVGFGVALLGLWFVSQSMSAGGALQRTSVLLALLAGLGFGGFFILIAQVPGLGVFGPLFVARTSAFAAALVVLALRRVPLPAPAAHPVALLAGVLDAGGNIFYVLAQQLTRLDVAAVLSSFYPAATVLLAFFVLKERVAPRQWLGAALCLLAVVLIAV